ncbi:MAG: polyprenyl synthetase, partial [Blastocatellia bacterium]
MVFKAGTVDTAALEASLAANRELVDRELDRLLPPTAALPNRIHEAIRWSVFAGGKRFRPALLIASGQTFGAPIDSLVKTACTFEMIHTYSLIHDDLPSMDDDDLRRGRPTCHVRFDEATAILAGDALQTLAFETIANDENLSGDTRVKLIAELGSAAGTPSGMVAGQALDIEGETRSVTGSELEAIHRLKTGALIIAAARCGAIIAQAR